MTEMPDRCPAKRRQIMERRCPACLLFTQAMARPLNLSQKQRPLNGPQKMSPRPGPGSLFQADHKGLTFKRPPPSPKSLWFSRPRGEEGAGAGYGPPPRADWWPFIRRRASFQQSLFVSPKSPGDSMPSQNDSLAPRPCPPLGDTQPGLLPQQSKRAAAMRLQVDVGSTE